MNQHRLVAALRNYLTHWNGPEDVMTVEGARQEVLHTIPQIGKWFFLEVDGQDYAVRVSRTSRIEIMRNIFNRRGIESHRQPSRRA